MRILTFQLTAFVNFSILFHSIGFASTRKIVIHQSEARQIVTSQNAACPNVNVEMQNVVDRKAKEIELNVGTKETTTFFMGPWSKVRFVDKVHMNQALQSHDDKKIIFEVAEAQKIMSARLLNDRLKLQRWIQKNQLTEFLVVNNLPEDGSFLFVKSNLDSIRKILCASAAGYLPIDFLKFSY